MKYHVTADEQHHAKNPHHIFNINVIIVHLAFSQVALEIGGGDPLFFLMIPIISTAVLLYIRHTAKKIALDGSWFVAANWMLAWRRGRILLFAYAAAGILMLLSNIIGGLMGGGLMMNDFSTDGSSTPIHEKITMFLGAVIVFVGILITFLQTGISVYEAGKGEIDDGIIAFMPRTDTANTQDLWVEKVLSSEVTPDTEDNKSKD